MALSVLSCFLFLWYAFWRFRLSPISAYIAFFIGVSYLLGVLVGNVLESVSFLSIANFIFVNGALLVFCGVFSNKRVFFVKEDRPIASKGWLLICFSILLFIVTVINIYIVCNSIFFALSGGLDITEYKNQGGAAEMIRTWVDPRLVFLSYAFSPLAYVSLALHFFFLLKHRLFLSVVFLIFALNIPLVGLHALSRSSIVHFALLYFLMYFFCYRRIRPDLKRRMNFFILLSFGFIVSVFYFITLSRFGDSSFYGRADDSFIANRVLYSVFDYASQWIVYSSAVLEMYTISDTWFGKSSFTAFDIIRSMIGLDVENYAVVRQKVLGEYSTRFIGLIATLIYDFSHLGVVYYICLYWLSFKIMVRSRLCFGVREFLIIIVFVSQPLMFFSNNYLGNTMYSIGSLYAIAIYLYFGLSFRTRGSGA